MHRSRISCRPMSGTIRRRSQILGFVLGTVGQSNTEGPGELTHVTTTTRTIEIKHVVIRSTQSFAAVRAKLEHSLPKLNPEITALIVSEDTKRLREKLEAGPELAIFLSRDHGSLLRITGHSRKAVQYDIGNPLTAS